ncbi:MAG: hypothetical protein KGI38_00105 [Thaumarchaeota archaeon]|nr:hypothetical protein [Nitrososphaerota archaeon]
MSEDKDPNVAMIELHEDFIQHMERGGRKIRTLALVATLASAYFAFNYFLQLIVFPFGLGITSQTVDLVDPSLMALEAVSLVIALLWFVSGLRDLSFARRVAKQIKEIRALQAQVAKDYGLNK